MKRTVMLSSCLLLCAAQALPAQNWVEVGDAGQLPTLAQVPAGGGMLLTINGSLAGDADMYLIRIDNPALFDASTVGGAGFDTQLFLFRTDGQGVTHDDDDPVSATLQSRLTGAFVPSPGLYCLAISAYNLDALGQGQWIWNNGPANLERAPDGPGRLEAIDNWGGFSGSPGGYTITLVGCSFPGRELVLPDNHHLSESGTQTGSAGSTSWLRSGGGRFQVIYEASHFLRAGVIGPIHIEQLLFRGDDGERNLGGQFWNNVSVQIGATTLTAATMYTTFAANLLPPGPDVTVMGPPGFLPMLQVWQSTGSHPNNSNIVLDLRAAGAVFPFDPMSPTPNLLIDITLPIAAIVPPVSGPVMDMQDTTGGIAVVRGAGVTTATPAAPTGTYSTAPPVVAVAFQGPGGARMIIPAVNEFFGTGCSGSPSAFYQSFLPGEVFDLAAGLVLTPDNAAVPTFYNVAPGAGAFDATKVNPTPNTTLDDTTVAHPLGFAFNFPGGSTTTIRACTNGYVWLNGTTTTADSTPSVAEMLGIGGYPERLMPCWYDFHAGRNTALNPNAGLHVLTDTSGGVGNYVCYATWYDVGVYESQSGTGIAGHMVVDMQLVIHEATGVVEFRYGRMPLYCSNFLSGIPAIVGFTRGLIGATPSVDPASRDLSVEVPFATRPEGLFGSMKQTAAAVPIVGGIDYNGRAFAGQRVTFDVGNVPPTALVGVQLIDIFASQPGIPLGVLAPGCVASLGPNPIVLQFVPAPGPIVTGAVPFGVPPGYEGLPVTAQFFVMDGTGLVFSSNAIKLTLGLE
ncbi:MAG: DVUA0089 family protein [Planctomycetota bacterium]